MGQNEDKIAQIKVKMDKSLRMSQRSMTNRSTLIQSFSRVNKLKDRGESPQKTDNIIGNIFDKGALTGTVNAKYDAAGDTFGQRETKNPPLADSLNQRS